jgi:aminoglycoside 6-adenylyltransferase
MPMGLPKTPPDYPGLMSANMRTENEMLALIVDAAMRDERIRAVVINGSRANSNAPRDIFQDFDVVYFVTDVESFRNDPGWFRRFGETMIVQEPEEMDDPPPTGDGAYARMMQFTDGNRIDLGIYPLESVEAKTRDSLTVLLLDKDGIVKPLPPSNEGGYLPTPPTPRRFADCCNEFWWVCPYVAKGLWRRELPYARYMLDEAVRPELMRMLTWYIGMQTGFAVNPGKNGKYFQKYLEPELWDLLRQTYAGGGYDETWEAMSTMCALFRKTALPIAERFDLDYPAEDDRRVSAHLEVVRHLPVDAKDMY